MRRTKEWWARLTKEERGELVLLERASHYHGSSWNLPEGYHDCGWCSTPTSFGNLCRMCLTRLMDLQDKAAGAIVVKKVITIE